MKTIKFLLILIAATLYSSCEKKVDTISPVAIEALKTIQPKAFDVRVEFDSDSVCMLSYCDPAIHEFYFAIDEKGKPFYNYGEIQCGRGENFEKIKHARYLVINILGDTSFENEEDYIKWAIRDIASGYALSSTAQISPQY